MMAALGLPILVGPYQRPPDQAMLAHLYEALVDPGPDGARLGQAIGAGVSTAVQVWKGQGAGVIGFVQPNDLLGYLQWQRAMGPLVAAMAIRQALFIAHAWELVRQEKLACVPMPIQQPGDSGVLFCDVDDPEGVDAPARVIQKVIDGVLARRAPLAPLILPP
jgi:hypothetical protein